MNRLRRIFIFVLLAVFTSGMVASAASATSMSLAMSSAAMIEADMDDCGGCPPGDGSVAPLCGQDCLSPFLALPAAFEIELKVPAASIARSPQQPSDAYAVPPDPPPPRIITLN